MQIPTQNGKMKILFSEFQPRRHFCLVSWCPETKQNTQNFEIQVPKGILLVKVFEISSRNGFRGLKMVLSCSKSTI
jgi:hypothetical protein